VTTATFSVAVLSQIESGIIAKAEVKKTAVSPHSNKSAAIEIGTKMSRINGIKFLISIAISQRMEASPLLSPYPSWHLIEQARISSDESHSFNPQSPKDLLALDRSWELVTGLRCWAGVLENIGDRIAGGLGSSIDRYWLVLHGRAPAQNKSCLLR
jgi:hypothetical protein